MTPLSSRTRHIRPGIVRLLTALLSGLQISSLDLALANGTLITLTPESNPHLWKAAQVSISSTQHESPM